MMFVSTIFESVIFSHVTLLADGGGRNFFEICFIHLRDRLCGALCDEPDHRMIYRVESLHVEVVKW